MLRPIVLCIDDRPEMLKLRKASLELRGFRVETATNGTRAIEALRTAPTAAVLLDYKLEGVDAQAIAYQVRQRYPTLPIVLLSAYSEMPASLLWLVDEYVMKSEPVERLPEVIAKVVSARKVSSTSDITPRNLPAAG